MEVHETHEKIVEAHGHGHGHGGGSASRRIALLIAVLAALLAITETAGKSAQHASLSSNIEASNLWAFFQAKTVRMTTMRTAAEALDAGTAGQAPSEAVARQVATWKTTAERYDSEPSTNEGRKELAARAKGAEAARDLALAKYHNFEYGSAAFQLAIVLASAAVVTGVMALGWLAGGLGLLGVALAGLGFLAPTLIHFH